jgi:hypothetical protein
LGGAHHRAVHDGELLIEGQVTTGVSFKHADGSDYGAVMDVAAAAVAAQTKAFQPLRHLGFAEGDARQALAETLEQVGAEADTGRPRRADRGSLAPGLVGQLELPSTASG